MELVKKATRADLSHALRNLNSSSKIFVSNQLYAETAKNYIYIGEIYFQWSKYQRSIHAYRKALRINPSSNHEVSCSAYSHLVTLYVNQGDFKTAISYAEKAFAAAKLSGSPHANAEAMEASGEAQLSSNASDKTLAILSAAAEAFHDTADQRRRSSRSPE